MPLEGATVNRARPGPLPVAPAATVIQSTVLVADQEQPAPVCTFTSVPPPDAESRVGRWVDPVVASDRLHHVDGQPGDRDGAGSWRSVTRSHLERHRARAAAAGASRDRDPRNAAGRGPRALRAARADLYRALASTRIHLFSGGRQTKVAWLAVLRNLHPLVVHDESCRACRRIVVGGDAELHRCVALPGRARGQRDPCGLALRRPRAFPVGRHVKRAGASSLRKRRPLELRLHLALRRHLGRSGRRGRG